MRNTEIVWHYKMESKFDTSSYTITLSCVVWLSWAISRWRMYFTNDAWEQSCAVILSENWSVIFDIILFRRAHYWRSHGGAPQKKLLRFRTGAEKESISIFADVFRIKQCGFSPASSWVYIHSKRFSLRFYTMSTPFQKYAEDVHRKFIL